MASAQERYDQLKRAKALIGAQEAYPEQYNALMDYLRLSRGVPKVEANVYLGDSTSGTYDRYSNTIETRGAPSNMIHELTHAAQDAMAKQMYDADRDGKRSGRKNFIGAQAKDLDTVLMDAAEKLRDVPRDKILEAIGKAQENLSADFRSYRLSTSEMEAFGMGGTNSKSQESYGHLNNIKAQDFMILLDVATRQLKEKEKQGKLPKGR